MIVRPPINRDEHRAALARVIDPAGWAGPQAQEHVAMLEAYAEKRGLSLEHCLIGEQGGHIDLVCICLDSPGRTSTVLLSPGSAHVNRRPIAVEMVNRSAAAAESRGIQLLQGMVVAESSDEGLIYAAAEFRQLTNLLYLQADHQATVHVSTHELDWMEYGPQTHTLFARVVEDTYHESLDCGSLNGIRHIEDILASHRATGQFDAGLWQVGMVENEPVGVVLLSFIEEQDACEVVYMGCLPQWRGRGYGAALLARGFSLARERQVYTMTISVDEKNLPARKLYKSFGFYEIMQRAVWIRLLFSAVA